MLVDVELIVITRVPLTFWKMEEEVSELWDGFSASLQNISYTIDFDIWTMLDIEGDIQGMGT